MTPARRRVGAEVYWRRRLLVLAAIFLIGWIALQIFDDGDHKDATPAPTATPASPTASVEGGPVNGKVKVSLDSAATACDPEKVRVTPSVEAGQFAGAPVEISLVVSSTQKTACTLEGKAADLLVVINSNGSAVWDNAVCKDAFLKAPVEISPGWASVAKTTWSGRGSGSSCSGKESYSGPGSYVIKAATIGGEPGQDKFELAKQPKPEPSETPATEPGPKVKSE